jgi:hypothetical protein
MKEKTVDAEPRELVHMAKSLAMTDPILSSRS